jgi:hypothetical protein
MGLFSQSCPLEKSHLEIYGIPSPRKWKKADCIECTYTVEGRCNYKQITARHEQMRVRGRPALAKRLHMPDPPETRVQAEKEALESAGFSPSERESYWEVSREYDAQWEKASTAERREILDSLDQWKVHLEAGLAPREAFDKAQEWLKQRAAFKHG